MKLGMMEQEVALLELYPTQGQSWWEVDVPGHTEAFPAPCAPVCIHPLRYRRASGAPPTALQSFDLLRVIKFISSRLTA